MDAELETQRLPQWAFDLYPRIDTEVIGHPLLAFDEVTSTNDVAKHFALKNAPDGLAVIARNQTTGRGRRGRSWASFPGRAVYLSVLLRPPELAADEVNWLGILGGVAAANALNEVGVANLTIKWPNDVLVHGRKISGVLVEPRLGEGKLSFAVIGIGLNVLQQRTDWPEEIRESATSCCIEGVSVTCDDVICCALRWIDFWYDALLKGKQQSLIDEWARWSGSDRMPVLD